MSRQIARQIGSDTILDCDWWWSRCGSRISGKSEFPQGWSDNRVIDAISDIATDPNASRAIGRGGRTVVEGVRDGINIRVIVGKDGEIITGFPTNVWRNQ